MSTQISYQKKSLLYQENVVSREPCNLAVHYNNNKGFQWTIEAIERVPNADGDEGYQLSVDAEPTSSVEQRNESKVKEAFANFDRYSIASK